MSPSPHLRMKLTNLRESDIEASRELSSAGEFRKPPRWVKGEPKQEAGHAKRFQCARPWPHPAPRFASPLAQPARPGRVRGMRLR
jgi:hypothetical protein